jgi:oligopeptide transport system substrate-binding protein
VSGPRLSVSYLGFDVSRRPFDDPRVRRAFTLATSRERLASVVNKGFEFPATGGLVPPGMPGHSPKIALPYDPDQARQLLAEAGYPGGHRFPELECLTSMYSWVSTNEFLQTQWREILGIEINWKFMEWGKNIF